MSNAIAKKKNSGFKLIGWICTFCQVIVIICSIIVFVQTIIGFATNGLNGLWNPPCIIAFGLLVCLLLSLTFNMKNERVLSKEITLKFLIQWLLLVVLSVFMIFL